MRAAAFLFLLLYASSAGAQRPGPKQLFQDAAQAQQSGNYALAVTKYQQLIHLHPDMVAARANLGVALVSLGRFDEATEQYRAALKLAPGNHDLRLNLALACYKGGRLADAAVEFGSLLKEDPSNSRIATLLSDCYLRLGRNAEVISILLPFEEADRQNLAIAWALGSAMIHNGLNREGLERVQKVADQKQLPEAYALASEAHLRLEEFDEARRNIDMAMHLDPKLRGIYTLSGMVREYASDLEGAEAAYRKAIEADANEFEPHLRLGAVLYQLRMLDEARRELERALVMAPASSYARFELAKVKNAQGQVEDAVGEFEKVAQTIPEWLPPHVELTALYYRLKRPEDGARQKQMVDRLTEEERQRKAKLPVISPQLPSRQEPD